MAGLGASTGGSGAFCAAVDSVGEVPMVIGAEGLALQPPTQPEVTMEEPQPPVEQPVETMFDEQLLQLETGAEQLLQLETGAEQQLDAR